MRQSAEVGLGRRGDNKRPDAGRLSRHDVHDNARRVHGIAAGYVQPDALDRNPTLGDRAARNDLGDGVLATLIGVHLAGALDRNLECFLDCGVEFTKCALELGCGYTNRSRTNAVELLAELEGGFCPAITNSFDHRANLMQHRVHIHSTSGKRGAKFGRGWGTTTQVGAGKHESSSRTQTGCLCKRQQTGPASQALNSAPETQN